MAAPRTLQRKWRMNQRSALPEALAAPRRSFDIPGIGRISYYVEDSATGVPLLLIHSVNAAPSAYEMRPLFEHYRGQRPVYAVDLPGFGFSDRSAREYSPEFYAGAIVDFVQDVIAGKTDVVALSLSAEFAARAALSAPEHFASLTLISPTGLSERLPPGESFSRRMQRFLSFPAVGSSLFTLLTSRASIRFFLGKGFVGPAPEDMIEYAYQTSHQAGAQHAAFSFLAMKLFTPRADEQLYAKLALPTLVLYDRDPNVGFERLDPLVQKHPNMHAERVKPSLGLPHWEHTKLTTQAMDAFWARHSSRTQRP